MVNLTRIYTKTGDDGTTSLGDMSRTSKNDPRLEAYATVDEANSSIGVVLALATVTPEVKKLLTRIQNDLFDVGADLCTPMVDNPPHEQLRILESQISHLEERLMSSIKISHHCAHSCFLEEQLQLRSYMLRGL